MAYLGSRHFSKYSVYIMETVPLSVFNISAETKRKLQDIEITSLYKVQSTTFEAIKQGLDVITLASKYLHRMFFIFIKKPDLEKLWHFPYR